MLIKTDAFVEKVFNLSKVKGEAEFLSLATPLCEQFVLVGHVKKAAEIGPQCEQLVSLVERKLGSSHKLTLLAKRQLATNYAFQSRYNDAAALVEKILRGMMVEFGEGSDEVFSAIQNLIIWYKNLGRLSEAEILAQAQVEKQRQLHPLCEHLKSVEDYLLSREIKTWLRTYANKGNWAGEIQVHVEAWLNLDSIQQRLQFNQCVEKLEWNDKSDSFRGFVCLTHKHKIGGCYEQNPKWPVVG